MEVYILKSAACMAIFLLFYKLLLEKESMHLFKRFYLLGSIMASFAIPFVVFTTYVAPIPVEHTPITTPIITTPIVENYTQSPQPTASINYLLWAKMMYILGVMVFGFRFFSNLYQLLRRIQKNTKYKLGYITHVLLHEKFAPHTFFNYIFLNKTTFESQGYPKEVLLHEETHAKQHHSFDVLCIEFLQVIFWFNPILFFFKKAIKLNHEFLADAGVLQQNIDKSTYQNTLLDYVAATNQYTQQPQLANAINYSSIKKRFTIMKTKTSKKAVLLRTALLVPLLALLLYGFSQRATKTKVMNENDIVVLKDIRIDIEKNGSLFLNGEPVVLANLNEKVRALTANLSAGETTTYQTAHIIYDEEQLALIDNIQSTLQQARINTIKHVSKNTSIHLKQSPFFPSKYHNKTIEEARAIRKEDFASESIWFDIKNEDEIWYKNKLIPLEDLAHTISSIARSTNKKNDIKILFYSTGILRSDFVDILHMEAKKANAKEVMVSTEEYIMDEADFTEEGIDVATASVKLKTNKISFYKAEDHKPSNRSVEFGGLILDSETLQPLESVSIYGSNGHLLSKTDKRGYYKVKFANLNDGEIQFEYTLHKKGYKTVTHKEHWGDLQGETKTIYYFGLQKKQSKSTKFSEFQLFNRDLSYTSILNNFHEVKNRFAFNSKISAAKKDNQHVLIQVDDNHYLVSDTGLIQINSKDDLVSINDTQIVVASELNKLVERNKITGMTPLQNRKALFGVYTIPVNHVVVPLKDANKAQSSTLKKQHAKLQKGATQKQLEEYNKLAKHYNTMNRNHMRILKSDVERLTKLYALMTDKQKAAAESFPDFPKPPPPPPPAPKRVKKGEKSTIPPPPPPPAPKRVKKGEKSTIPPPPPPPAPKRVKKGEKSTIPPPPPPPATKRVKKGEKSTIPPPPPPSKPTSPLDHLIAMAKKDAKFYFEGKEISSDKAIELLKKNENIHINSSKAHGKQPIVKLAVKPITTTTKSYSY